MVNKAHTTWNSFGLFHKDFYRLFIEHRLAVLARRDIAVVKVEARSTKNANCAMVTFVWSLPTVINEKERNRIVLQSMRAIVPFSNDVKLFWHKPSATEQIIDATVLLWTE